jgi:hypothetical protein
MSRQDTVDVRLHAEEDDVAAFGGDGRDDAGMLWPGAAAAKMLWGSLCLRCHSSDHGKQL